MIFRNQLKDPLKDTAATTKIGAIQLLLLSGQFGEVLLGCEKMKSHIFKFPVRTCCPS